MKKLIVAVSFGLLVVSGCTSASVSSESTAIPTSRMYWKTVAGENNSAELTITRDPVPTGRFCYFAIFIEKKLAARIAPSERAVFYLEPGEKLVSVKIDPNDEGHCAHQDVLLTEKKMIFAKDEKKSFRLTFLADGWPLLEPVSTSGPDQASAIAPKATATPTATPTPTPLPSPTPEPTSAIRRFNRIGTE